LRHAQNIVRDDAAHELDSHLALLDTENYLPISFHFPRKQCEHLSSPWLGPALVMAFMNSHVYLECVLVCL